MFIFSVKTSLNYVKRHSRNNLNYYNIVYTKLVETTTEITKLVFVEHGQGEKKLLRHFVHKNRLLQYKL